MARISTGTMTVGIFAVLFGLVGAYALRAALVGDAPEPPAPPRTASVPLAAHDLPAGRRLSLGDMVLIPMTHADMQARNLPLDKTMLSSEQIVGRILHEGVKQGDPFLTTNMYPEGTGPKLSDKLKPGMRAVTVPIDNLSAVGGSTVEGSFVDVLFRAKAREADPAKGKPAIPATTVTLLENVEVLSVGRVSAAPRGNQDGVDLRNTNRMPSGASLTDPVVSVTIAVSPDQANVVKAVLGQGDMSLALRADPADGAATPNKYTLESVLGVASTNNGYDRIEIFRGGWQRQNISYENNRLVRDETTLIPGLGPTSFPVPEKIPAQPKSEKQIEGTQPTPNFYQNQGSGMGWGGYGWGAGAGRTYGG